MSVFGINASARFTQDEIRHFSAAQMAQLAIHAPPVYSAKDADIVAFLQKKNITSLNYAERVMARAAATAVPQLRDRTIRPDQYTKDTATPVVYTKEKIEFRDTPAVSIPLSVVPTEKPQRVGSSSLVALFGMVLEVSAGSWRTRGEPASLTKVYKNAINLNVLFPLAQEVAKALNLDPVFVNMPTLKRNDISKDIAMKFIVEYFARLSDFDYLTIHCVVVYEVFNIYQKLGPGKGYRARDEKYRVVKGGSGKEPSWFSQADGSAIYYSLSEHERSEILKTTNNAPPKMFVGRALLEVVIPKADTIQKVAKVIQLVQGVGSDNMGPFMLYGMKDFTGMHTHNGRRIMLLTSLAAGELKNGYPVDIHVTTSGDVPPLAYSMQHVIKYLDLNWTCETGYFRIILTPTDYRKVSDCKEHAQAEPRQDEVVICGESRSKTPVTQIHFIDTGLPSSEEKSKPVNWESRAVDYLFMKKPRWIYVGPIFGHYMFGLSPPQSTSTVEIPLPPHKRAWAYCFGDGSTTRGVLADHEISFYGLEYGGKGDTDFSLVKIDVKSVTDPESWYRYVRNENGQKLSSWLSPVTRYSPISNLFRQSRRGAMQAFQEQLYEEGGLTKEQIVSLMSIGAEDNVEGEVFQGGLSPASFAQTNSQVPLADTRSDPTASSANSIPDMNSDDDGDSGGEVFQ